MTVADEEQAKFEIMAQIIGVAAASKLLLTMWGSGKPAAALERLAELGSEREYNRLHNQEDS